LISRNNAPHYLDKPKYTKAFEEIKAAGYKDIIPLSNHQAIIVEDYECEMV
jgi:hypothetical protein